MEALNKITTEEAVNLASEKILSSVREKIKDQIADAFYKEMDGYLYEHYQNHKDKLEKELIEQITERFIQKPMEYKFAELRKKLFNENKELLTKTLTDEAIQKSVEDVIEQYTHRDYIFHWRWKDAIVKTIIENFDKFKNDERVQSQFIHQIENLKSQINCLQQKLNEISVISE